MAKRKVKIDEENEFEGRQWREGELIEYFKLNRITNHKTALMEEWLDVKTPIFNIGEQYIFDRKLQDAINKISGWSEEDLKMKFITHILELGLLTEDDNGVIGYFDKVISATVENIKLTVKSDFMMAKGILNVHKTPYFHFQEYKPQLNPKGEPMAQLLEAFLIGQEKNNHSKPLYGIEVIGETWKFVIMENKDYCISKPFNCLDKEDLLKIIAILRKFKEILITKLIN